ncbi:MAG: ATP-grasp domain-containing protein [Gammaproteobacteria bacterium]
MADSPDKNIFVLGLNDFNLGKLKTVHGAEDYAYHGLLSPEEILEADAYPIRDMIDRARQQLHEFQGSVDAIIGYMDFPVSTMLPILKRGFDLPGPSLESLLKCEHKYWSRLEQQKAVPDVTPAFAAFNPFDKDARERIDLPYPFWVKPIKSAGSWLGFRIGSNKQFDDAVQTIRQHIGRFGDPFNYILEQADLPEDIARVGGNWCIAEQIIGGRQITVEGYVLNGSIRSHGIIDSILYPGTSSFFRYQYPSGIPEAVKQRMLTSIETLLTAIGYDNSAFNIEFFWDEATDQLWLLEINTRVAQHHSDLFEKVDGVSNHQVTVDVALGLEPHMQPGAGLFNCAAACWLRHWRDGIVRRVPTKGEIAEIEERMPGTVIELEVHEGKRLAEIVDQDSYSYVLALIYVGGMNESDLLNQYEACVQALRFEIEAV